MLYWFIAFFPAWTIHLLVFLSLVALFVSWFVNKVPFINKYFLPIQIVATLLLVSGIFLEGSIAYKQSVEKEVADLKVKLAEAEAKASKTNIKIVEKLVKDTKVIRTKGDKVIEYVNREIPQHDAQCKLPEEVINAHNMAATIKVDSTGAVHVAEPSKKGKDSE